LLLTVETRAPYTPWTVQVPVKSRAATTKVALPQFITARGTALASALMKNGARSKVVRVVIQR